MVAADVGWESVNPHQLIAAIAVVVCALCGYGAIHVVRGLWADVRKAWAHTVRGAPYDDFELLDVAFVLWTIGKLAIAGLLAAMAVMAGNAVTYQWNLTP